MKRNATKIKRIFDEHCEWKMKKRKKNTRSMYRNSNLILMHLNMHQCLFSLSLFHTICFIWSFCFISQISWMLLSFQLFRATHHITAAAILTTNHIALFTTVSMRPSFSLSRSLSFVYIVEKSHVFMHWLIVYCWSSEKNRNAYNECCWFSNCSNVKNKSIILVCVCVMRKGQKQKIKPRKQLKCCEAKRKISNTHTITFIKFLYIMRDCHF